MTTTPQTIDTPAVELAEGDRILGQGDRVATITGHSYTYLNSVWLRFEDEDGARWADFVTPRRTFRRIVTDDGTAALEATRTSIAQLIEAAGPENLRGNPAAVGEAAYLIAATIREAFPGYHVRRSEIFDAIVEAVGPSSASSAAGDLPAGWTPPAELVRELRIVTARRRPFVKVRPGTWTRP